MLLEVVGLFKYCVWKGRNEVEKEGKSRSGVDMLSSFLALLKFRGKADYTASRWRLLKGTGRLTMRFFKSGTRSSCFVWPPEGA